MPTEQKDKDLKLIELENSIEVEEYFQWRKWANVLQSTSKEINFKDTFKLVEEGYLKTNLRQRNILN